MLLTRTIPVAVWSDRLSPTPGRSTMVSTPAFCNTVGDPIPESSSIWGELMAPPQTMTSRFAFTTCVAPL